MKLQISILSLLPILALSACAGYHNDADGDYKKAEVVEAETVEKEVEQEVEQQVEQQAGAYQTEVERKAEMQKQLDAAPDVITFDVYPAPAKQPNFGPSYGSIQFVDTDPGETIGGTLSMVRAVDADGNPLDETAEGISMYMIHWGLEVGAPGVEDDKGAGDHGGDCKGFRDTGHVVMAMADELGDDRTMTWEIPQGTEIPENAVYFVGHAIYGQIHNLGKCTQTPIFNAVAN